MVVSEGLKVGLHAVAKETLTDRMGRERGLLETRPSRVGLLVNREKVVAVPEAVKIATARVAHRAPSDSSSVP
jgi:hypothetical protein